MADEAEINGTIHARGVPTRVNLRETNPGLWRIILIIGITNTLQGIDFLATVPTFEQFGIPHTTLGVIFLTLGVAQLVALLGVRSLMLTRVVMFLGVVWIMFWGVGTTTSAFAGESSFQLFVLYYGFAALQIPLLLEPYFNPVTATARVRARRSDD